MPAANFAMIDLPDGWATPSRPSGFYAVPIIIAASVIVAFLLAVSIAGVVFYRQKAREKKRGKKLKEAPGDENEDLEKTIEGRRGKGRKNKKGKGKAKAKDQGAGEGEASGRSPALVGEEGEVRRRTSRRERASEAEDGGDEGGNDASGEEEAPPPLPPTTGRFTARLRHTFSRRNRASAPVPPPTSVRNPSVVFSRSLEPTTSERSSTTPPPQSTGTSSSSTSHQSLFQHRVTPPATATTATANANVNVNDDEAVPVLHATPPPSLGQPADPPASTLHPLPPPLVAPSSPPTSEFGFPFPPDLILPTPGPPAYRPNSTTINNVSRLTASLLPPLIDGSASPIARSSSRRREEARRILEEEETDEEEEEESDKETTPAAAGAGAADDEEGFHWPNEKEVRTPTTTRRPPHDPQRRRRRQAPLTSSPSSSNAGLPPPLSPSELIDPSEFTAHLATDDKSVLARLRAAVAVQPEGSHAAFNDHASTSATAEAGGRIRVAPSAPVVEVDEEGYEILPPSEELDEAGSVESGSVEPTLTPAPANVGSLPAPPRAIDTSTSFAVLSSRRTKADEAAEEREAELLESESVVAPGYSSRVREALEEASAPPVVEEEEEEEGEEDGRSGHGIV